MKDISGGLENVVAHLEAKGVLTASDTTAIVHALENLKADAPPAAPPPLSSRRGHGRLASSRQSRPNGSR
jgi:hypothetical protein